MEIQHLFTTPVSVEYLQIDNNRLEHYCQTAIAHAVDHPNQSGRLDVTAQELQPLLDEILLKLEEIHIALNFKVGTKFKIDKAWANLNNSNPIDLPHCHPGSTFSAVYYIKGTGAPENGNLILLSPLISAVQLAISDDHKEVNNRFNSWHCTIPPETGKLVIFPSWVMHSVSPNRLPSDRMSIAIDAVLVNK